MRLLLDTHVLLWWLAGDRRLRRDVRDAIESPDHDAAASVATIWEIEIKRAAGRLNAPLDVVGALDQVGLTIVAILASHAVAAARLPGHHADPFDRMLIAQAGLEGLTIVTRDERMAAYGVPILAA